MEVGNINHKGPLFPQEDTNQKFYFVLFQAPHLSSYACLCTPASQIVVLDCEIVHGSHT